MQPELWNGETDTASAPRAETIPLVPSQHPAAQEGGDVVDEHRPDVGRLFEDVAFYWATSTFRARLLDAPREVQERFLREVLLPELHGLQLVLLVKADVDAAVTSADM